MTKQRALTYLQIKLMIKSLIKSTSFHLLECGTNIPSSQDKRKIYKNS